MESLWGLLKTGEFTCALGPMNLSLFIAVIVLALIAKKAFCGWACPIGFIGELVGKSGGKIFPKRFAVGDKLNGRLKLVRYAVLIISLYFTYKTGELILRGYDPFYLLFSGFGHGTVGIISYVSLIVFIIGWILIPMFFCRYLCPLGAVFDPFSRLGLIKIIHEEALCTKCGDCQSACPHHLAPFKADKLRHHDCTNCLECIIACPEKEVLKLQLTL
jgi:polyferredoxin